VLAQSKQIKFKKGEANGLGLTANVFHITGNYPKALELYLEALKKSEEIKWYYGIGGNLTNIASLYDYQGDYQQALNYALKAKEIAESQNLPELCLAVLNVGDYYEKLNRLDSALSYAQRGNELAISAQDSTWIINALHNLGNVYSKINKPVIAKEFYRPCLPYYIKSRDNESFCKVSLSMARLFQQEGKSDSSFYYAKLSQSTAERYGFPKQMVDASNFLSDFYKGARNIDSAFKYQSIATRAKDSLFSQEKSKQIQNLTLTETLRQKEIEAEKQRAAEEHKHNLQYAAIAVAIIIFTGLFLLLSHSIIVNEKWIEFLGVLGLLAVFEFINLLVHPYLGAATHHSPVLMLLALMVIAALLVPLHHKVEHWVTHQMIAKNKRLRLAAARRTISRLEGDPDTKD
jgi:tetratricopeptide (TPR) repeat protein